MARQPIWHNSLYDSLQSRSVLQVPALGEVGQPVVERQLEQLKETAQRIHKIKKRVAKKKRCGSTHIPLMNAQTQLRMMIALPNQPRKCASMNSSHTYTYPTTYFISHHLLHIPPPISYPATYFISRHLLHIGGHAAVSPSGSDRVNRFGWYLVHHPADESFATWHMPNACPCSCV